MKPTQKQIAARKRNWKLAQLKQSLGHIKTLLPNPDLFPLIGIEKHAKIEIDRIWKIERSSFR